MTMTDPIADFLTRVRNALQADREEVDIPASAFKAELARILSEQGYIEGYSTEPARVGEVLRLRLKYTEARDPVISGLTARVAARAPHLRGERRGAEGTGRDGHRDRDHLARGHDRARGEASGCGRRGRRARLVIEMADGRWQMAG